VRSLNLHNNEGLGKMLIVQSLILFARWYTKMLLMTVGDDMFEIHAGIHPSV
jgi:hypothetical protein